MASSGWPRRCALHVVTAERTGAPLRTLTSVRRYIHGVHVIMMSALVVLIVAGVALMIRSDSPTWFFWPFWPRQRLHWVIWVIAAVLWALMLAVY
jgi:hypothetical protein